jgi:hypothetical protein
MPRVVPRHVPKPGRVVQITCGAYSDETNLHGHSLYALTNDGRILRWTWQLEAWDELRAPDTAREPTPR